MYLRAITHLTRSHLNQYAAPVTEKSELQQPINESSPNVSELPCPVATCELEPVNRPGNVEKSPADIKWHLLDR